MNTQKAVARTSLEVVKFAQVLVDYGTELEKHLRTYGARVAECRSNEVAFGDQSWWRVVSNALAAYWRHEAGEAEHKMRRLRGWIEKVHQGYQDALHGRYPAARDIVTATLKDLYNVEKIAPNCYRRSDLEKLRDELIKLTSAARKARAVA